LSKGCVERPWKDRDQSCRGDDDGGTWASKAGIGGSADEAEASGGELCSLLLDVDAAGEAEEVDEEGPELDEAAKSQAPLDMHLDVDAACCLAILYSLWRAWSIF